MPLATTGSDGGQLQLALKDRGMDCPERVWTCNGSTPSQESGGGLSQTK